MSDAVEAYRQRVEALAVAAASTLRDLYAELVPGTAEEAEPRGVAAFVGIGSRFLAIANRRAALLADRFVAAPEEAEPAPVPPVVTPRPAQESQRLAGTLTAVVEGSEALLVEGPERVEAQRRRVEQVGRSEPIRASQAAVHEAMAGRGVAGWVRVLNPGACDRCKGWADNKIRPASVVMKTHLECGCTAAPVPEGDPRARTDERERVQRTGKRKRKPDGKPVGKPGQRAARGR